MAGSRARRRTAARAHRDAALTRIRAGAELPERSESVAVLAALANAIGQIGDRRAIPLLVALTKDDEQTKLGRAFAAAALGGVCERLALPWNLPLSRDANYGAPVDTLSNGATGVLDIL